MRILKISKCDLCPYFRKEEYGWCRAHCVHRKAEMGNEILNPSSIPEWCPLEVLP